MAWAARKQCKNSSQKLVLIMLGGHSNGKTGQCNPSHKLLAEECCMSVSSLKTQIRGLAELGYLSIVKNSKNGVSLPNQYVLNLDGIEAKTSFKKVGQNLATKH